MRTTQASLVTKTDFDAKLSSLSRKITKNKTDHLIAKNELNKLKAFDSSYFIEKSRFEEDGIQNYVVFQPLNILKLLLVLIQNIFYCGNLKDYQTKLLSLQLQVIINVTQK